LTRPRGFEGMVLDRLADSGDVKTIGSELSTFGPGCILDAAGREGGKPKSSSENCIEGNELGNAGSQGANADCACRGGDWFSRLTFRFLGGMSQSSWVNNGALIESDEISPKQDGRRETWCVDCGTCRGDGLSGRGGSDEIRSMTSGIL
jgi:hypothetical protein